MADHHELLTQLRDEYARQGHLPVFENSTGPALENSQTPSNAGPVLNEFQDCLTFIEEADLPNPSSTSQMAFWYSEKVLLDPETYHQIEATRKIFSAQRMEDVRRQLQRDIDEQPRRDRPYCAHLNCADCHEEELLFQRIGDWARFEQPLSHKERRGAAYVLEDNIMAMKDKAWRYWINEESDRSYKLCDTCSDWSWAEFFIEHHETRWIGGGRGGILNAMTADYAPSIN